MRRSQLPFLFLSLIHSPIPTVSASSSTSDEPTDLRPCTLHNSNNGYYYDLNTIAVQPLVDHKKAHKDDREESWHARGWDYSMNFTINFCAPVIETLEEVEGLSSEAAKNVSAFYKEGDKTFSIG